jgi:hypothetical protein
VRAPRPPPGAVTVPPRPLLLSAGASKLAWPQSIGGRTLQQWVSACHGFKSFPARHIVLRQTLKWMLSKAVDSP